MHGIGDDPLIQHILHDVILSLGTGLYAIHPCQHLREVHPVAFQAFSRSAYQSVRMAYCIIDTLESKGSEIPSDILSHHAEVVAYVVRTSFEFHPVLWILRSDPYGAGVGLTSAAHYASDGDHERCCETVFLGTEECCNDYILACLQLTVNLKSHLLPEAVQYQGLLYLGETKLPWHPCIPHR